AVDTKDTYGRTLLWWAVVSGHEAIAGLLLENGGVVDAKDTCFSTLLSNAASSRHETVMRLLLENSAPVDAQAKLSLSTISVATFEGRDHATAPREGCAAVDTKDIGRWIPLSQDLILNNCSHGTGCQNWLPSTRTGRQTTGIVCPGLWCDFRASFCGVSS